MLETQETQVRSLGRGDPLEKEMATDYSILAWEKKKNAMDRGAWWATVHRAAQSAMTEQLGTQYK